ncbi:MAG TPA: CapA family protein, partial [Candidatus Scatomorpha pullistercoris]|nr:CapA family protein [Candidatus Scatomorpha pullistercoris]
PTPEPTPEPTPSVVKLTLAGDLVMHTPLHDEALQADGSYDYTPIFEDVAHYIEDADYSMCTLEAALIGDEGPWKGYPLFHSPDDLAYSLKDLGFDLINYASNHAMDAWHDGIIRTLDVLDDAGLEHNGAYRTPEERAENNGILVKEINGISFAFLDYTYGTNGFPVDDVSWGLNVYTTDYMTWCSKVDYEMLDADMAAARALDTDIIAVVVHWGGEYVTGATQYQTSLADYFFEQGADLVIGGHPHVPAPMELRTIENEDGTTRTGFVCYCLGNLISCQTRPYTDLSAMVQMEITKDAETGEAYISSAEYIPMLMLNITDYGMSKQTAGWGRRLWDIREAIADYEAGDTRGGVITPYMYQCLQDALADCERIFGTLEMP